MLLFCVDPLPFQGAPAWFCVGGHTRAHDPQKGFSFLLKKSTGLLLLKCYFGESGLLQGLIASEDLGRLRTQKQ